MPDEVLVTTEPGQLAMQDATGLGVRLQGASRRRGVGHYKITDGSTLASKLAALNRLPGAYAARLALHLACRLTHTSVAVFFAPVCK